jgi:nitroreductase
MPAMETWDAIRARRDVRQYADRPIDPYHLDQILEAGRRSPSASNRQRWDFVVCTDRRQLQELSRVWEPAGHIASSAATIVLLSPQTENLNTRGSIDYDLGQVTISMMLAAADLGIGSGHASVGDQELARQILGHPRDRRCAYMIALGYPVDRPLAPLRAPNRRPFDEVVHRGHW